MKRTTKGRRKCACRRWLLEADGAPMAEQVAGWHDDGTERSWLHTIERCGPARRRPGGSTFLLVVAGLALVVLAVRPSRTD